MPTITQSPIIITAGQSTDIAQGQTIPYGTIGCVIYNSTAFILQVTSAGGTQFLQPAQADAFLSTRSRPAPSVIPVTTLSGVAVVGVSTATVLGTVTAAFFDANDGFPSGFPQPLNAYPGGQVLLWQGAASLLTIAIPPGAGSISLAWKQTNVGIINIVVTGVQTGTQYYNAATVTNVANPVTIPLFALQDSSVTIQMFNLNVTSVYANAAFPVPTIPNLVAAATLTAQNTPVQLIAAPTTGAWYLFDWDFYVPSSTASSADLELHGSTSFSRSYAPAGGGTPGIALNGYRVTSRVDANQPDTTTNPVLVVLRYAAGP